MQKDQDVTNEPQEYAITINALVKADSYMELRKRVTALQALVQKALKSNPNTDGYYISVDDIISNIKPPIVSNSPAGSKGDVFPSEVTSK